MQITIPLLLQIFFPIDILLFTFIISETLKWEFKIILDYIFFCTVRLFVYFKDLKPSVRLLVSLKDLKTFCYVLL